MPDEAAKRTIWVVGNAKRGASHVGVKSPADRVVRFNDASLYDEPFIGDIDILCLTNTGEGARRFLSEDWQRESRGYRKARTIVLPRTTDAHLNHFQTVMQHYGDYAASDLIDLSDGFVEKGLADGKEIIRFSNQLNVAIFKMIMRERPEPFICPSTGFMMIMYLLLDSAFRDFDKHVMGFGFEGWCGHPWDAERAIVSRLDDEGKLTLHPVDASIARESPASPE